MKSDLGKIHIYTGGGKGKTTAALGLALRALGAGYKIYLIQFLKGRRGSELKSLKSLKKITVKRFGEKKFIHKIGAKPDKLAAQKALAWAKKIIGSGRYDLVILDEIFLAVYFKLIGINEIIKLIKGKPEKVELVLTGRRAPKEIIRRADYATEMKEIKHPYRQGLAARKGIED